MSAAAARQRGFTLVELMVTVAILAVLTSLAVGGYRQYTRRANRVDATSALLRLASAQEKYYAQNGQYAGPDEFDDLGITATERGYYALAVALAAGGPAIGYVATATVDPAASQADDEDCWVFGINERGLRAATTRSGTTGAAITDRCWR